MKYTVADASGEALSKPLDRAGIIYTLGCPCCQGWTERALVSDPVEAIDVATESARESGAVLDFASIRWEATGARVVNRHVNRAIDRRARA